MDDDRRIRQVIGPRIPKQWLDNIDDASLESAVPSGDWYTRDLFDRTGGADVVDDSYDCQLGAVAVLMGDNSAVTVIQEAHTRILLRAGVLQEHELIGGGGINANAVAVFPSSQSEVEVLLDEITPAGLKKKEFQKVIDYATDGRYDFLYINNHADPGKRVRKNLDEIINLDDYKK